MCTNKHSQSIIDFKCALIRKRNGNSIDGKNEDTMAHQSKDGEKKEPLKDALSRMLLSCTAYSNFKRLIDDENILC